MNREERECAHTKTWKAQLWWHKCKTTFWHNVFGLWGLTLGESHCLLPTDIYFPFHSSISLSVKYRYGLSFEARWEHSMAVYIHMTRWKVFTKHQLLLICYNVVLICPFVSCDPYFTYHYKHTYHLHIMDKYVMLPNIKRNCIKVLVQYVKDLC